VVKHGSDVSELLFILELLRTGPRNQLLAPPDVGASRNAPNRVSRGLVRESASCINVLSSRELD
jgi:hypothetical protein